MAMCGFLLLLGTGCAASRPSAPKAPPPKAEAAKAEADRPTPGSEYDRMVINSPIGKMLRGELEPETDQPLGKSTSVCTPNGLFTASEHAITLQIVCIRVYEGSSTQSLWYGDPVVVSAQRGRHELPFRGSYLVRQGEDFMLFARLANGKSYSEHLQADEEGIFSFEDVINRLKEIR